MHQPHRWNIAAMHAQADELAARLKCSPLVAQILINRGISDADDCANFLRPSLKCLHEPSLIPNLNRAAERIAKSIRDREKIVIYGDYDVDGITATAILWHALRILGAEVEYYIPHRVEEGYGLNSEAVAQICDGRAKLIVTVDCGVTAIEPARIAQERDVELIVTDHHEFKPLEKTRDVEETREETRDGSWFSSDGRQVEFPQCVAIVHPRFPGAQTYPNPNLCGAGV